MLIYNPTDTRANNTKYNKDGKCLSRNDIGIEWQYNRGTFKN